MILVEFPVIAGNTDELAHDSMILGYTIMSITKYVSDIGVYTEGKSLWT